MERGHSINSTFFALADLCPEAFRCGDDDEETKEGKEGFKVDEGSNDETSDSKSDSTTTAAVLNIKRIFAGGATSQDHLGVYQVNYQFFLIVKHFQLKLVHHLFEIQHITKDITVICVTI